MIGIDRELGRVGGPGLLGSPLLLVQHPQVEVGPGEPRVVAGDLHEDRLRPRELLASIRHAARFRRFWVSLGWISTAFSR